MKKWSFFESFASTGALYDLRIQPLSFSASPREIFRKLLFENVFIETVNPTVSEALRCLFSDPAGEDRLGKVHITEVQQGDQTTVSRVEANPDLAFYATDANRERTCRLPGDFKVSKSGARAWEATRSGFVLTDQRAGCDPKTGRWWELRAGRPDQMEPILTPTTGRDSGTGLVMPTGGTFAADDNDGAVADKRHLWQAAIPILHWKTDYHASLNQHTRNR